ncbi:hypothetical protein BT69DRAFT_1313233 [Atractiella rhizophila]|nr:hypothetical protein BT69DRAFT_1313233 [Atractiella rhizophila]
MSSFAFSPASTRTLTSLNTLLSSREYYSAHQKLRTTAARLLKSSTANEYDDKAKEAVELLFEGAKKLLEHGERGSGADCAEYVVEVWTGKGVVMGKEERAKVFHLIALFGPKDSWRTNFISSVLIWTAKTGTCPAGDLDVHAYIGEMYYKETSYQAALGHLLLSPTSSSALTAAEMLFNWSKLDPAGEVESAGRYASKAVLTYLSFRLLGPATVFLSHYLSLLLSLHPSLLIQTIPHPSLTSEVLLTPLPTLNNLQLAILNIRVGVGEAAQAGGKAGVGKAAWLSLRGKWEREAAPQEAKELKNALAVISEVWFGIRRPGAGPNVLGDLMSSLFGGGGSAQAAPAGRRVGAGVESAGLD